MSCRPRVRETITRTVSFSYDRVCESLYRVRSKLRVASFVPFTRSLPVFVPRARLEGGQTSAGSKNEFEFRFHAYEQLT